MLRVLVAVAIATAALPLTVCPVSSQAPVDSGEELVRPDSAGAAARAWLEIGVGGGWVRLEDAGSDHRSSFALDLGGGFWLRDQVGLGVRLGGWTLEGFNPWDSTEGESVSEVFAVLRLRPLEGQPLVASVEGGWVSYTVNDPAAVSREGDGLGARAALAWDAWVSSGWVASPALVWSWGDIEPDSSLQPGFGYWGVGLLLEVGRRW